MSNKKENFNFEDIDIFLENVEEVEPTEEELVLIKQVEREIKNKEYEDISEFIKKWE